MNRTVEDELYVHKWTNAHEATSDPPPSQDSILISESESILSGVAATDVAALFCFLTGVLWLGSCFELKLKVCSDWPDFASRFI